MDQKTIFNHVKQVLQELLEDVDLSDLTMDTSLKADLHIDSTMALDVAYRLCRHFQADVPFERWFVGQEETDDFSIRALTEFLQKHI